MKYGNLTERIRHLKRSELISAYSKLDRYIWPEELGAQPRWWRLKRSIRARVWDKRWDVMQEIFRRLGELEYRQVEEDGKAYGLE